MRKIQAQVVLISGYLLVSGCAKVASMKQAMAGWIHHGQVQTAGLANGSVGEQASWSEAPVAIKKQITIHFAYDSSGLTPAMKAELDQQAAQIISLGDQAIQVVGHTDERGSREYNLALGWRRARAVSRYLMQQGVLANQVENMSFGKEKPVDFGHTQTAWAKNRRVVLRFLAS